jgi:hypothetical protein
VLELKAEPKGARGKKRLTKLENQQLPSKNSSKICGHTTLNAPDLA